LNTKEKLYGLVQDTLRGSTLAAMPFFDRKKVLGVLDSLDTMDESARVAYDPIIMTTLSMCVLQERFKLAA
jgi:asparagine synthase (glutamine-hydrolysing)